MLTNDSITLSGAIELLAKSVKENETVVVEVRHSCVVKDALKEARKAKFCVNKTLNVIINRNEG